MATKKTVGKKSAKPETHATSMENVTSQLRDMTVVSLGFYGTTYDEVQNRAAQLKKDAPKQWDAYLKRGEKLQKDITQTINDSDFSINIDMEETREQLQSAVDKVRNMFTPAAAS